MNYDGKPEPVLEEEEEEVDNPNEVLEVFVDTKEVEIVDHDHQEEEMVGGGA